MKTLRFIGTTLLMVVLCLNFTACGDDDDDDTPTSEKLVGQWILVYEEGYEKNGRESPKENVMIMDI